MIASKPRANIHACKLTFHDIIVIETIINIKYMNKL